MPVCKNCKAYNGLGVKSCKKCNHIIPVDEGNPCPNCSIINGPFAKICTRCGYSYQTKTAPINRYRLKKHLKLGCFMWGVISVVGLFFLLVGGIFISIMLFN